MNVTGYADALASALDVEVELGFSIKIVSLPAMVALKILAWNDRPERDKDASDVLLILRNYHDAGHFERIYGEAIDLLGQYDFDLEIAGSALLGRDANRDLQQETTAQLLTVFADGRFEQLRLCETRHAWAGKVADCQHPIQSHGTVVPTY